LPLAFVFRFPDDHTEVISTPRTGSGEVYSHAFSLTLEIGPYNLGNSLRELAGHLIAPCLVDRQGRLSIQSLHSLRPCSSAASLLLKIGPWMRWTSTIELRLPGRRTMPWAYQSNPVAKVGTAEPSIRNPLYRSISHCLNNIGNNSAMRIIIDSNPGA